jgi:hypothetical protein
MNEWEFNLLTHICSTARNHCEARILPDLEIIQTRVAATVWVLARVRISGLCAR